MKNQDILYSPNLSTLKLDNMTYTFQHLETGAEFFKKHIDIFLYMMYNNT